MKELFGKKERKIEKVDTVTYVFSLSGTVYIEYGMGGQIKSRCKGNYLIRKIDFALFLLKSVTQFKIR